MKAIILSAGYGTRLQPLTHLLPKPLMPVLGRPMLAHIIERLQAAGMTGIGINVHHKKDRVRAYLDRACPDREIALSVEKEIMGVGGGIRGFREFLKNEKAFVVHNGDILSNVPIGPVVESLGNEIPLCTLVVHDCAPYNNVVVDPDGNVLDLRGCLKPAGPGDRLAYTGIAIMHRDLLDLLPEGPSDLIPLLVEEIKREKGRIRAVKAMDCCWRDVGTVADYLAVHREILLENKPLVSCCSAETKGCFLGENVTVAKDVLFSGFVSAGRNTVFKKGCRIENAVVWDNAVIGENTVIRNAIVGEGWTVEPHQ